MQLDASSRNADWISIAARSREFERWSAAAIDAECRASYCAYAADVRARHIAYYEARPAERSDTHAFVARLRGDAFPPNLADLADVLPNSAWHRHHLSGASSQVLAIAVLGAARNADPTLSWLPPGAWTKPPLLLFEVTLAPHVLGEQPRQTSLDALALAADQVVAIEAKFTERGFGTCSCSEPPLCASRVLQRPYWRVARTALGLRRNDTSCGLSVAYQPVRNLAAAAAIAGSRDATFVLLYDVRNPYFSGGGEWPGWVTILNGLAVGSRPAFVALSWQSLVDAAELSPQMLEWLRVKHGISP